MTSTNTIILRLACCLCFGIIIGNTFSFSILESLLIASISIGILGCLVLMTRKSIRKYRWIDILVYSSALSLGILTVTCHNHSNFENHYINNTIQNDSSKTIQVTIIDILKPSRYHYKYKVDIQSINSKNTFGYALLNISKDSLEIQYHTDDVLIIRSQLEAIDAPKNPYQFDYNAFLKKKYIYQQIYADKTSIKKLESVKRTLKGYAAQIRFKIDKILHDHNFKDDELAIINAMILGQRQDISKELYESYTQAGAVHILAVSGLHVGIILMLLQYLFKPLELYRRGRMLKIVIIVILLWCYAYIAGLSASVIRAVSMFSVFAIAMNLKRTTNVYNTLAISAFVLLLFKPNFLFDVGFQLSYLAVLSIVTIEPMLSSLWQPKWKIINLFWRTMTVTTAAQFGVMPLSLYYFHQFPGLFFITNMVIIPCLGIILGLGLLIIILALLNILPQVVATLYSNIISKLNGFITWVSNQEDFLFQYIPFNIYNVLFCYALIILLVMSIKFKKFKATIAFLLVVAFFQCHLLYSKFYDSYSEFVVFHKSRYSLVGFTNHNQLELHHNLNDSIIYQEQIITNYNIGKPIKNFNYDTLQNVYSVDSKTILVIDSLGTYKVSLFQPDFIVLRNSPKINLTRLIDSLNPELIISDGSNYRSYQERWKRTCETKKIPFHQTSEKGAFVYRYKD